MGCDKGVCDPFGDPVRQHDEAGSVEEEFVVGAGLVDVEHGGAQSRGGAGDGVEPPSELVAGEGARREIDDEVCGGCVVDGVGAVAGFEGLVVAGPEVFADGEQEALAAEGDGGDLVAGQEVAGLVEDVVGGEQDLVVAGDDGAILEQECSVLELAFAVRMRHRKTNEERGSGDGRGSEEGERFGDGRMESGPLEEVSGRVAGEREFGCDDEVVGGMPRLLKRSEDESGVSGEVTDPRIELRCEDLQG